jgi:hypothetical protein
MLLLAAAGVCFGMSNAVTIQEKSGSVQTKRLLTIPRYFAQGEICQYPAPYTGGTILTYWQADVKTRWPVTTACVGGSVRFALVTVETTFTTSQVVEFRNSASTSSGGSGLTQTQMLNFDTGGGAGSWGAKISTAVGTLSAKSISARTMIAAGMWTSLESGPLRTSVLVREGPDDQNGDLTRTTSFGGQCTAGCTEPYASGTWADNSTYYSIRPSFVVTFYSSPDSGQQYVEVDNILDNGWMDRFQDQYIASMVMYNGGAETSACYTAPAAFVLPAKARTVETCWSATAPAINIDFNLAYVTYTKVVPSYIDHPVGASAVALEVAAWTSTDLGATVVTSRPDAATPVAPHMGWGEYIDQDNGQGGSLPWYGPLTRWDARYIASGFNKDLVQVVVGNAKAFMHAPLWYLENKTAAVYMTKQATLAFGREASIDARPDLDVYAGSGHTVIGNQPTSPAGTAVTPSCTAPTCMVSCTNPNSPSCGIYSAATTSGDMNNWGPETNHLSEAFFVPYLFTGKYIFLEANWALSSWVELENGNSMSYLGAPYYQYSRWSFHGLVYGNIRGTAWNRRQLGMTALISPDSSIQKAYFTKKLNNNLEAMEGQFNITNGYFSPTGTGCTADSHCPESTADCTGFDVTTSANIWKMAGCYFESSASAQPSYTGIARLPNPTYVGQSNDGGFTDAMNMTYAGMGGSPWMDTYFYEVLTMLRDWGFAVGPVQNVLMQRAMHLVADTTFAAGYPNFISSVYRIPTNVPAISSYNDGYIQTFATTRLAHMTTAPVAIPVQISDSSINILTLDNETLNNLSVSAWPNNIPGYYQIDSEIVYAASSSTSTLNVSSVNTGTSTVTVSSNTYTEGQLVRVNGNPLDSGMIGSARCKYNQPSNSPHILNNNCDFYVHNVVAGSTLQFYSDAALTNLVTLTGGSSGMTTTVTSVAVTRHAQATTATTHSVGAVFAYLAIPIITGTPPAQTEAYPNVHLVGLVGAVDYDVTTLDEGTGKIITAKRAYEQFDANVLMQWQLGSNISNCAALSLGLTSCDDSLWAIRPRPLIRNVRVIPGTTSAAFYYTAPDGNGCKVGVSATPFASTDSSGDTADGKLAMGRAFTAGSLTTGTQYYYRITCGTLGGAARVAGTFTTN